MLSGNILGWNMMKYGKFKMENDNPHSDIIPKKDTVAMKTWVLSLWAPYWLTPSQWYKCFFTCCVYLQKQSMWPAWNNLTIKSLSIPQVHNASFVRQLLLSNGKVISLCQAFCLKESGLWNSATKSVFSAAAIRGVLWDSWEFNARLQLSLLSLLPNSQPCVQGVLN